MGPAFHGDRGIIGQPIRMNGRPFTVVGVAAEGLRLVALGARPGWLR